MNPDEPYCLVSLHAQHRTAPRTTRNAHDRIRRGREPHESIPALRRGQLDLAVVQDWADDPLPIPDDLSRQDLRHDVYDVALPTGHPLAHRDQVAIKELCDDDWFTWSVGHICHSWLLRTLRTDGIEPRMRHTVSEHSTQLALVAAGEGVALIPRLGREPTTPDIRLVPVEPSLTRQVFALWRTSAAAHPAISATLDALKPTPR